MAKKQSLKIKKRSNKKLLPKRDEELKLKSKGFKNIIGLDEVGRGALAGPVVAAACLFNIEKKLYKIRDSKLLSAKQRRKLERKIKKEARAYAVGSASHLEIAEIGIHQATLLAFERAISNLNSKIDYILVDAYRLPNSKYPHKNIIKGDAKCFLIAAASIIAKVYRDSLMRKLHQKYPRYYFHKNKGYGTAAHLRALAKHGPCEIHRRNFSPIKFQILNPKSEILNKS